MHIVLEGRGTGERRRLPRRPREVEIQRVQGEDGLLLELYLLHPPGGALESPAGKETVLVRVLRGGVLQIHGRRRTVEAGEVFVVPRDRLNPRGGGIDPVIAGAALVILVSLVRLAAFLS